MGKAQLSSTGMVTVVSRDGCGGGVTFAHIKASCKRHTRIKTSVIWQTVSGVVHTDSISRDRRK